MTEPRSWTSSQDPFPDRPREIGLVLMSALGDVVHGLPVATALKRAYPWARLTWIVQPVPSRLLLHHPAVDSLVVFHRRRGLAGLRSFAEVSRPLRARRFDLLLDLQIAFKAGIVTALARADVKLGFDRARAKDLNWLFTNRRIPPAPVGHVQDQFFEFLAALGIDHRPVDWGLAPSDAERSEQAAFFARFRRPVCAVVVATSRPEKNWPPERYARLIDALEADFGFRCMLVGGPSAVEREAAARVAAASAARPVDALGDDVRRLVWLLAGSDLVVAPDTGPLHIARALDVPVVGLYGYTNPNRFGPYRRFEDLVVDGYARYDGEDYGWSTEYRPDGMARITVERVLERVGRAVDAYLGARPDPR